MWGWRKKAVSTTETDVEEGMLFEILTSTEPVPYGTEPYGPGPLVIF